MRLSEVDRDYLTRRETSQVTGLAEQTLAKWASDQVNLPFVKCGRAVRYRKTDIEAFLQKQTIRPVNQ